MVAGNVSPAIRSDPAGAADPVAHARGRLVAWGARAAGPAGASALSLTLAVSVAVYLTWPGGVGGVVFVAVSASGLVGLVLGPTLRRAAPRTAWALMAAAGCLFLVGLVLRIGLLTTRVPVLSGPDVWSISAYLLVLGSLWLLNRAAARGSDRASTLDATIVTLSAALGFFSAEVGPRLDAGMRGVERALLQMSYPVLDAALLALTVHLAFRTWRRSPALLMLIGSATSLLVAELAYVVFWHGAPGATTPWIDVLFMVAFALMGAAAVHPSVKSLAEPSPAARPQTMIGLAVLLLAVLVSAAVSLISPPSSSLDTDVRVLLLILALGGVLLRMHFTINALSQASAALARTQAAALHHALHDHLTGLPNRVAYRAAIVRQLSGQADHPGLTLLLLDSDNFKLVNDTWGHPVGDLALEELAHRLTSVSHPGDEVFRLDGDAFAVLVPGADLDAARDAARRLLITAAQPMVLASGARITMSASVGVAIAEPGPPIEATTLTRDAEIALYAAKDAGRATFTVFDESLRLRLERTVTLGDELRDAVTHGHVVPFYQPIMAGPGFDEVCGFEALARWISPTMGRVRPDEFIPIAESTGLIVDIGRQMLLGACAQLAEWRRLTSRDLHMSVNVSAVQIARDDIPVLVREALQRFDLPPEALWLEITESVLVHDREAVMVTLRALADLGVMLCLDDFGTGYSSLSYLKDFPVSIVKVDRSFVTDVVRDPRVCDLTKAIIEMVRTLQLRGVVAEGVDQLDQADLLARWGCEWGQGFLWSQPLAAAEAEALLLKTRTGQSV